MAIQLGKDDVAFYIQLTSDVCVGCRLLKMHYQVEGDPEARL